MHIKTIQLKNYRCYEQAEIRPCEGVTALVGGNAQGKTNILESVVLCATGRSHRTSKDAELIRWGAQDAHVYVAAERIDGSHEVELSLRPGVRKGISICGKKAARSGELMGHVSAVLFSPEDLRMVKDGPAERRRFIDMELSQMRPAYYYELQRYNRAVTQRNCLLRDVIEGKTSRETLMAWDMQLAESGAAIIRARRGFLDKLAVVAAENHRELTEGVETLQLQYAPGGPEDEQGYLEALEKTMDMDIRRGSTGTGPHRDDLIFLVNDRDARAFGSQGQQRTVALSMKLSELRVMKDEMGEWPALLLDDVMSELDPVRRRALIARLKGVQTMVSCTDMSDLAGADIGDIYWVSRGVLHRKEG